MCTTISPTLGDRPATREFRTCRPRPASRAGAGISSRATPSARAMYRRRRASVALVTALVVAPLWTLVGPAAASPPAPGDAVPVVVSDTSDITVHIVAPGDTLWSIARRYAPEGDVRRAVDQLARINGGTDLVVGDRLVIPW